MCQEIVNIRRESQRMVANARQDEMHTRERYATEMARLQMQTEQAQLELARIERHRADDAQLHRVQMEAAVYQQQVMAALQTRDAEDEMAADIAMHESESQLMALKLQAETSTRLAEEQMQQQRRLLAGVLFCNGI